MDHVFLKQLHDANGVPQSMVHLSPSFSIFWFPRDDPRTPVMLQCYPVVFLIEAEAIEDLNFYSAWQWLVHRGYLNGYTSLDNVGQCIKSDQIWSNLKPWSMKEEMRIRAEQNAWCFYSKPWTHLTGFHPKKDRWLFSKAIYGNPAKRKNTEKSNPNIGTKSNLVHPFEVFTASDITSICFVNRWAAGPPGWMTVGSAASGAGAGAGLEQLETSVTSDGASWARAERELSASWEGDLFFRPRNGPKMVAKWC